MLEHGLPVIVTRDDFQPRVTTTLPPHGPTCSFTATATRSSRTLVAGLPKRAPHANGRRKSPRTWDEAARRPDGGAPRENPALLLRLRAEHRRHRDGFHAHRARVSSSAGHEVILITLTGKEADDVERPYPVIRRPVAREAAGTGALVRRPFPEQHQPAASRGRCSSCGRPWVVAHHTWIRPYGERFTFRARLKTFLLRYSENATISQAIADRIPGSLHHRRQSV